ncbi:hypothetical protein [Nitratireductor sp. XY-223]|uniref:hypothetical protein n=1 Tax=Nitratireductor sp. XY-223 TaxID=2561926 RepID=UPI0010A9B1A4|nr:hypothetical protein [Nitratireductor sp. XY-223]
MDGGPVVPASRLFGRIGNSLENRITPGVVRVTAPLLFLLVIIAVAVSALVEPEHNWDMAPYIAVALERDIQDPAALHKRVWGIMESAASADQFHTLTQGSQYNIEQYTNPENFHSQLGMYRVKYGYVAYLRFLGPIMGYVEATQAVNAVSVLVIGLVLLMWLYRSDAADGLLLLAPFMLAMGFLTMAQIAVPDLMTFAAFLVAVFLLRTGHEWPAVPVLLVAFAIRPDGIILIFALLLAYLFLDGRWLPLAIAFALSLAGYVLITRGGGHPGWWPHFVFSNVEMQSNMNGFDPQFSIATYLKALVRGVFVAIRDNVWLALGAILMLGWAVLRRAGREPRGIAATLLLAQLLCVGGKFVTFPLPDDRVYFLYLLLAAVLLLESWKPRFDLAKSRK